MPDEQLEQPRPPKGLPSPGGMTLLGRSYQRVHAVLMLLREYFEDAERFADPQRQAIDFVRAHPGCWICIPSQQQLEEVLKRDQIVGSWMHDRTKERRLALSQLHDVPVRAFRQHEQTMIKRQQREAERAKHKRGK